MAGTRDGPTTDDTEVPRGSMVKEVLGGSVGPIRPGRAVTGVSKIVRGSAGGRAHEDVPS